MQIRVLPRMLHLLPGLLSFQFLPSRLIRQKFFAVLFYYGVVPKRLLAFLGSLYKEVPKTTSGTLVYRFERQTARKKLFLREILSST